jgi:hypothetical protein
MTSWHSCPKLGKAENDSLQNNHLHGVRHIYLMHFAHWLQQKHIPDSDRISTLIHAAGQDGIPEGKLRSQTQLPKALMDELLAALVQSRMVRVAERDGMRWYYGW